ncbi:glycosyltransferase [Alkalihalobacillus sp. LMS39]|uniref:glycosyltransferase family 32 protein n=1 Tax=Alkalihalobacillus sp. LMS39 TaxID=2924032 RepID=UPI001FB47D87|nr:glycosyltransferase [Alkalihalobacillus sp. LMS39]UOE95440.1 glycosyl transferase [Alkalihalobacillus sp. LMS39]
MSINENQIPKIIHYCWFGGNEKPALVKKCLESWEKHLPDYEIKEWNESNVNLDSNQYVKEAYSQKKYAFVSDYIRVHALYHNGGIYLDTDVEVFQSFTPFLQEYSFWGFEQENFIATSTIGARKHHPFIKSFLDSYEKREFIKEDHSVDDITNVAVVTKMLKAKGLVQNGQKQTIDGVGTIYPQVYFSPYDYINCQTFKTEETYAMHHYYKSWLPLKARVKSNMKTTLAKVIGGQNIARLRKIVSKV